MAPPVLRGVVMRTRPFSETSLWVRLYTMSHGKLTGLAKGGRKGTERIYSPFIEVEARGYPPRAAESGLWTLARPELLSDWRTIASDPDRLAYAWGVLEVTDQLVEELQPHAELYGALVDALSLFAASRAEHAPAVLVWFLLRLADELGYTLHGESCPRCQEPLVFPVGALVAAEGGVLCQRCTPPDRRSLAPELWEVLVELAALLQPPTRLLTASVRDRLLALLTDYLSYHADRPLHLKSLELISRPPP
jgi:DNA repair protein RecO (recombination protein O)